MKAAESYLVGVQLLLQYNGLRSDVGQTDLHDLHQDLRTLRCGGLA